MSKKTRKKEKASSAKKTIIKEDANSYMSKTPVWKFDRIDFNHESWNIECCDVTTEQFFRKLRDLEGQTWQQIETSSNGKHHFISFDRMCKEARDRAKDINILDYGSLYFLRVTGKLRLFGILENGEYSIVWYDKGHGICPSIKKHT